VSRDPPAGHSQSLRLPAGEQRRLRRGLSPERMLLGS
jgi:hypothetical protein